VKRGAVQSWQYFWSGTTKLLAGRLVNDYVLYVEVRYVHDRHGTIVMAHHASDR
jgi:hypothetical protein